jgi:hypothetical protein
MEGDDDHETDSDDGQKHKEISTPSWKYVTKLWGGKAGGTTKFICSHCHKIYTGSYTHVRKHLCGITPWDEAKTIGVKTCDHVRVKDKNKYKKEEKATQNKSNKSRVKSETSSTHKMFGG